MCLIEKQSGPKPFVRLSKVSALEHVRFSQVLLYSLFKGERAKFIAPYAASTDAGAATFFKKKRNGPKNIVIEIKNVLVICVRRIVARKRSLVEKCVRVVGPKELTGETWLVKVISKQGSRRK